MITKILFIGHIKTYRAFQSILGYRASVSLCDTHDNLQKMHDEIKPNIVFIDADKYNEDVKKSFKNTPVVAMVSNGIFDVKRILSIGVANIIGLPVDSDTLLKIISECDIGFSYVPAFAESNPKSEFLLKKLSILYVEDDDTVRAMTLKVLEKFFSNIITAPNGEAGFQSFIYKRPDMVISDIQMPIMTGLDMAKAIRSIDSHIPIIITTAHNDAQFFQECIETKIDRFVFKPIFLDQLAKVFTEIGLAINDSVLARAYKNQLQKQDMLHATNDLMYEIIGSNPNPTIVFTRQKLIYSNSAFEKIVSNEILQNLQDGMIGVDFIFVKHDGYMSKISEYVSGSKAMIKTLSGSKRIFSPFISRINLPSMQATMLILHDITALEYQKCKYQNSVVLLRELLHKREKTQHPQATETELEHEILDALDFLKIQQHQDGIISASQYALEETLTHEEMDEFIEIEEDINDIFEHLEISLDTLFKLSGLIKRYASAVNKLIDFSVITQGLLDLSNTLQCIKDFNTNTEKQVLFYLRHITQDLKQWREHVFITKEAQDIHYIDASLLSNCLQAKIVINGFNDSTYSDLELF